MNADEAAQTISATLARLGVAETALGSVAATIARAAVDSQSGATRLPTIAIDDQPESDADFRVANEIGRGGMGIVRLAEQRSLGRLVAMKTTLGTDGGARIALLREARTMGGLEHPNVVPVHTLGLDASGSPVLVMKRIEGVSWRTLLDTPDHEAWGPLVGGHGNRMRANVEILAQVARALAFAHDRGVVHRDLKPENVMLGRFGEVYLLDWGVALRLDEREREPDTIVGTPGYLAPEMARGVARDVDERTDVYLLGATLFELLTGTMPHAAPSAIAALASALLGDIPPLPEDAPSDLADLVRRALALDPADRPASAEAFRTGLAAHLVSHEADVLIARADAVMSRARAENIETSGPLPLRSLLEARFSLRAALDLRPGDPRAIERLDACTATMIDREIAGRNAAGARDLATELTKPVPRITEAIEALDRTLAAERTALEAARDARAAADISSAAPIIAGITLVLSLAALPLLAGVRGNVSAPIEVLRLNAVIGGALAIAVFVGRKRVLATPGSRRITAFMVAWALNQAPVAWIEWMLGMPVHRQSIALVTGLSMAMTAAILMLPGLWGSVALHALAIGACALWPDREAQFLAAFFGLNVGVIVFALRQRARDFASAPATEAAMPAASARREG